MVFISVFRNYLNSIKNITFPNYLTGFWIKGGRFDFLKVPFLRAESIILRILARKQRGGGKR